MSERKWTAPQRAAIEDTGGALLVSAAAGSGKTAVLVQRVLRMITRAQNPIQADRLLILTFTNAAAEELRSRIAVQLEEALFLHPANRQLRRQRLALNRAFIGTIDAFCQQLVRENFIALDLPADIAVGEASLLGQLAEAALAETMEEMYADANFAAFAALYGKARSDVPAENAIRKLYAFTRSLPWPEKQLEAFAHSYVHKAPFAETAWGRELMGRARRALNAIEDIAAANLALAQEDFAGYIPALEGDLAGIAALRTALGNGWDDVCACAHGFSPQGLKPVRGGDEVLKGRIKDGRERVKAMLAELREHCFVCTEAEYHADLAQAAPLVAALARATALYAEKYGQAKLAEHALDFFDFEHLALQLLTDETGGRSAAAARVCARYDAVMVDEYQDTNALQSALYESLALPDGSNLFYVGDVKQSIYRFRSANPDIFLEKKNRWPQYAPGANPSVVTLGHNFRSAAAVIDGVNHMFRCLMSPELGDVDYNSEEELILGAEDDFDGSLEVCVVQGDAEGEAAWVAARIAAMVQGGALVRDDGATRPCSWGDFCIMMRTAAQVPVFVRALEARGIPVAAQSKAGLLAAPEVLAMTAALGAIDNPGDDVSLAAAMLGPLFRFTPDEMTRLRAQNPKGRLWGAVSAAEDEKTRAFAKEILHYRSLAMQMPVGRLCEELAGRTGYLSAVAAMEQGVARRENLLRFIGWAGEVSAHGRGGLGGFMRLLQAGGEPGTGPAKPVPGHVNLLTIHRSKGLEFPVCFLCDTGRGFNKADLHGRVQMHPELGVGLALRSGHSLYPTAPAMAIRSRAARESASEEMRLLYVALTRAKDHCVITVPTQRPAALLAAAGAGGAQPSAFLLAQAHTPAQWILAAALRHPAVAMPVFEEGEDAAGYVSGDGRFVFRLDKAPEGAVPKAEVYHLDAEPNTDLVQRLAATFAQSAPRAALSTVPLKVSVSALTGKQDAGILRRPAFMHKGGLTAAERGTAQHSFMQYADFAAAQADLEAEIARLAAGGFMPQEYAAAVDRAGLRAFFASPLAQRMAGARRVLREYSFLTAIPAGAVDAGLPAGLADAPVMLQGIADLVLVGDAGLEIVDYKTDRNTTPETLVARYAGQLGYYRLAVQKRLGLPVRRLTIWSFALNCEVDVPLGQANVPIKQADGPLAQANVPREP